MPSDDNQDNHDAQAPQDHHTHPTTTYSPSSPIEDHTLPRPQRSDELSNFFDSAHPDDLDINDDVLMMGHYQGTNPVGFELQGSLQDIVIGGTQAYPSMSNNASQSSSLVSPYNGSLNSPESDHLNENTISPSTPPPPLPPSNPALRPLAPAPSSSARVLLLGLLPQPSSPLGASVPSTNLQPIHLELTVGTSLSSFTPDVTAPQQPALSYQVRIKLYAQEYRDIEVRLLNKWWYPKATQAAEPEILPNDEFVLAGLILLNAKTRFEAFVYSYSKKQHYCRIVHTTIVGGKSRSCRYVAQEIKDVIAHVCEYLQYSPYECEIEHGNKKCTEKFTTVQRRNDHHSKMRTKLKLPQGVSPKIECKFCQKKMDRRNERRHLERIHPEKFDPSCAKQRKKRQVTHLQSDVQE